MIRRLHRGRTPSAWPLNPALTEKPTLECRERGQQSSPGSHHSPYCLSNVPLHMTAPPAPAATLGAAPKDKREESGPCVSRALALDAVLGQQTLRMLVSCISTGAMQPPFGPDTYR